MTKTHPFRLFRGFSAIEMMITLAVSSLFILTFYALFSTVTQSFMAARQHATASDIAYTYLRRYAGAGADPSHWFFVCDTTTNYELNPSANGQTVVDVPLGSATGLHSPVTVKVIAIAPYGCSGADITQPIKIEASVTYGVDARIVRHATLVERN